ncbi:MAG: amidase [Rhodococcus sp. (in: high G+C Gram-positive bacteria)]
MIDPYESAVALAHRIKAKEVSSVEVVQAYLDRIDRLDGEVNSIVWRNDAAALAAAAEADKRTMGGGDLPAFHGVPIPVKDLTSVAGQPNTQASLGISDAPQKESDLVVDLLTNAGFVLCGRSNSPELGPMSVTENKRWGVTRNPWNLDHTPGGSSGGAAAAVIAGFAPVAHANDGGGSIRMPSSCCGTVGLKPARGRVPNLVPSWEHSTTEGAITRSVGDCAAMLDVLGVPDRNLFYNAPAPRRPYVDEVGAGTDTLRIGLMTETPTGVPVDPECVAAAERLAALLESRGHVVEQAKPVLYSAEAIRGYLDVIVNASMHLTDFEDASLAEPYIRHRLAEALKHHSGEYARAAARIYAENRPLVSQWGRDFDVLLTPTMATLPPRTGIVLEQANGDPTGDRLIEDQMIAFTAFCNISGLPAISLPVHMSADGLPVGAQLVGAPFDEATLIRLAASVEDESGWLDRVPPAFA